MQRLSGEGASLPIFGIIIMAKNTWVKQLKKGVQSVLKGPGHSKAGKKEVARINVRREEQKGMSRQVRGQLEGLSDADYKAVMKAFRGKK